MTPTQIPRAGKADAFLHTLSKFVLDQADSPLAICVALIVATVVAFALVTWLLESYIGPRLRANEEARLDALVPPLDVTRRREAA